VRVLGIDPGSRYCGFGVVEDAGATRVRHLAHGVLRLGESGAIEDRLRVLYEGLSAELARHRPEMVAVEDVFHARNARSALVLGEARGVALLAAAQSGVRVRSFAPSVIKQAVTGTGRAEKDQVGRMVAVVLGIPLQGRSDASDALAAAICGVLRARDPEDRSAPIRRDWRAALARRFAK
jgi:crossover junction endodeoxyribonuclease RuvC